MSETDPAAPPTPTRDPNIVLPPDCEITHTSRGLTIRRNATNKFTIASLLFYADPAKDSDAWIAEARAGLTDAQFRKEYLLDYCALFGERVFPEISAYGPSIVLTGELPPVPRGHRFFGGFDYGSHSPSSFHVYTILDGIKYCLYEVYEPCKNISAFVDKMKLCPFWDSIAYIAADPSIWAVTQQALVGPAISIYQLFVEAGVFNLIRGTRDEAAWVAGLRRDWSDPDDIRFRIYGDRCPAMVQEFEKAIYSTPSQNKFIGETVHDEIASKNNHALDDCKYAFNSQPTEGRLTHRDLKWPKMVSRWTK